MRWSTTGGHINLFRKRAQPWHTIGDRTEWQAIADEIKPALILARTDFVKVLRVGYRAGQQFGYACCLISGKESPDPVTRTCWTSNWTNDAFVLLFKSSGVVASGMVSSICIAMPTELIRSKVRE